MTTINKLNDIYKKIQECHICTNMDPIKCLRNIKAIDLKSDILIVSQALASTQLRLSGVNFFNDKGEVGNTGKNLEKFLNKVKRTIYPYKRIELLNGFYIPERDKGYISVYNTEITQCFPGKNLKGDRIPTSYEIRNCIKTNFMQQEIFILKPKIILLMGRISYENFFLHILKEKPVLTLSEYIDKINYINTERKFGELSLEVLPIQHPSGANPGFNKMLNNSLIIDKIKNVIQ